MLSVGGTMISSWLPTKAKLPPFHLFINTPLLLPFSSQSNTKTKKAWCSWSSGPQPQPFLFCWSWFFLPPPPPPPRFRSIRHQQQPWQQVLQLTKKIEWRVETCMGVHGKGRRHGWIMEVFVIPGNAFSSTQLSFHFKLMSCLSS